MLNERPQVKNWIPGERDECDTVAERVVRGRAWFERFRPDWFALVNPVTLDITSPRLCMLGQGFHDGKNGEYDQSGYGRGLEIAANDLGEDSVDIGSWAWAHGFNPIGEPYEPLNAAWRAAIALALAEAGAEVILDPFYDPED